MKRDGQDEADGETITKHRDFGIAHRQSLPERAPSNRNCIARAMADSRKRPESRWIFSPNRPVPYGPFRNPVEPARLPLGRIFIYSMRRKPSSVMTRPPSISSIKSIDFSLSRTSGAINVSGVATSDLPQYAQLYLG